MGGVGAGEVGEVGSEDGEGGDGGRTVKMVEVEAWTEVEGLLMRGGIEAVQRDAKKVDGEEVERWRSNGRAMVAVKEKVNTDVRGGQWTRHKGEARTEVAGGK